MQFTLNNTQYYIEEFDDGFAWFNDDAEAESCFPTALEAQQDAIRHEMEREDEEELSERDKKAEYEVTHATSNRGL
jgi:hypothetical protein